MWHANWYGQLSEKTNLSSGFIQWHTYAYTVPLTWMPETDWGSVFVKNPYRQTIPGTPYSRMRLQSHGGKEKSRELTVLTTLDLNYFWELDSQIIINNFSGSVYELLTYGLLCNAFIHIHMHTYTLYLPPRSFTFYLEIFKHFHKIKRKAKFSVALSK